MHHGVVQDPKIGLEKLLSNFAVILSNLGETDKLSKKIFAYLKSMEKNAKNLGHKR